MSLGPRWQPTRRIGDVYAVTQTDAAGVVWRLMKREQGGRVLHWESAGCRRKATTAITPAHQSYPSDDMLAAEAAAEKAELRAEKDALKKHMQAHPFGWIYS